MTRLARIAGVAGATSAALLLVSCGGDDEGSATTTSSATSSTVAETTTTTAASAQYTVESGDTLSGIAQHFGTTVEALVAANEMADPDTLEIGQVLEVPSRP